MSNQKWQIGPVKLVNGLDAVIHRFCNARQRYLGEIELDSGWHVCEWGTNGRNWSGEPGLGLAPTPKKTVRVKGWLNVNADGSIELWEAKERANEFAHISRVALRFVDLGEVEEGEGLP